MEDAIDVKYYRDNGSLRMDKEKFVESFLRRFANSIDNTRNYRIGFYDLNEVPPKVSIKVDSATVLNFEGENLLMSTTFDGIVESIKTEDEYIEKGNSESEAKNFSKNSLFLGKSLFADLDFSDVDKNRVSEIHTLKDVVDKHGKIRDVVVLRGIKKL